MASVSGNNKRTTTSTELASETKDAKQSTTGVSLKKVSPQSESKKYISLKGLGELGRSSSKTGAKTTKTTTNSKDLQPDPNQRTVTDVNGRVVGFDKNFNPVTEASLKEKVPENKLAGQPVNNSEASSSLSKLVTTISGNDRINQEFFSYLEQKYANSSRPPAGMDVYQNPQNYTPEQKLARYIDLIKVKAQFEGYRDARLKPNTGNMMTILNEPEITKDIDQAMQTLMEDPAVAGLLSTEYLQGAKEILEGKRFQTDEKKYDQAYTDSVSKLRTEIQDQFKSLLVDGGLFKDSLARGVNERTILANYNTSLQAFGSVLGSAYVEQHQDSIQSHYSSFYSSKVEPLLPDPASSFNGLLYNATLGLDIPESLKGNIGLITPTIDGQTYVDVGIPLKTEGFFQLLSNLQPDAAAQKEMAALGLDPNIPKDGVTAAFLPTVTNMATQVFGTSAAKKADRDSFTSVVLKELRPLLQRLDGGIDQPTLGGLLERVRNGLRLANHPMASYANEVTTALNGLVRGANLMSYPNKSGNSSPGVSQGGISAISGSLGQSGLERVNPNYSLKDVQALLTLSVGYEGKGLAKTKNPEGLGARSGDGDNSEVAKKVFGTENRMWDSMALQRFGLESLDSYAKSFATDLKMILPSSMNVENPIIDSTALGLKAVDEVLQNFATAVAKGLFGNDEAAVKAYATNLVRLTYNLNSALKPGGFVNKMYATAMELASQNRGTFFEGSISVDDQMKTMAKYSTVFLSATRSIHGGVMNAGNFNPATLASTILTASTGASHVMDLIGSHIKPSIDARVLAHIGEYADAAKQLTRTTLLKGGGALNAIVDIAWLPVDIYSFVRNLKAGNLDTAEKIFTGIIIGSDVGVAVDAGVNLTRTLVPSSILQTSRFASLFTGTGGAVVAGVGAAFNLLNAAALIGLNIWQNIKAAKAFDKAGRDLDANLYPLVGNTVSNNQKFYPEAGDPWGGDAKRKELYQMHLDNMYKHDTSPFDWDATRAANRERFNAT